MSETLDRAPTALTCNGPVDLLPRHNASGCNEAFAKAGVALKMIAMNALK